jgi:uncharacterized protein involved in exopolysaccharide biosynthesis
MKGQVMDRGYTLNELWAAAQRRARPGLIAFGAAVVLGAILVAMQPNEYRAQATIILEPYRAHPEMVLPAVTTLMEDRLRIARQQLLSRPVLEKVVVAQNLYPAIREKNGIDAAIENLRRHLEVHPDGESAVIVGFRTSDADKAAPVVQAVADGYVQANADLRMGQAQRVLDIIQEEIAGVSQKLADADARVKEFKRVHDGELPEQLDANLRDADRTTHLLDTTQGYLRGLQTRLSSFPSNPTSPEVERLGAIESDLVRQLTHAQSIFTHDHPEPQRLQRELDNLRSLKQRAVSQLKDSNREKDDVRRDIARAQAEVAGLEGRIKQAKERAAAAAKWGSELGILERDRDLLREKYRSLMSRKVEGEVSLGLEAKSAPLATRVVDPPTTPVTPFAPDRMKLMLVVLALAAGFAVGTGVLLESKDSSIRSPVQAREQLDVPLLAVLPPLKSSKRSEGLRAVRRPD